MISYETIDVRKIPSVERHQQIIARVLGLKVDEGLILVVDHDPKPLYYLLKEEHKMDFDWKYLEKGPVLWQVLFVRKSGVESMRLDDIIGTDLSRLRYFARLDPRYCLHEDTTLKQVAVLANRPAQEIYEVISTHKDQSQNHFEYWKPLLFTQYIRQNYHAFELHEFSKLSDTMNQVVEHHSLEIPSLVDLKKSFDELTRLLKEQINQETDWFEVLANKESAGSEQRTSIVDFEPTIHLLREINRATDQFTPPADACPLTMHLYDRLGYLYDDVVCHIYLESTYLPINLHQN
ncbi:MAG: DUF2249 domain-containing protein [Cyclobacteriaceae bacterium]